MQISSLLTIICLIGILLFCKYFSQITLRMKVIIFFKRVYVKNMQVIMGGHSTSLSADFFGVDFFYLLPWHVKSNLANVLSGTGVKRYYINCVHSVSIQYGRYPSECLKCVLVQMKWWKPKESNGIWTSGKQMM